MERSAGQSMIRVRRPNQPEQVARCPVIDRHGGDDDLGEHIEGVLHDLGRFDLARPHRRHDRRDLHRVIAEGRHEHPPALRAQGMAGSTDALERRADALR
jgi:hypothetical protein